MFDWLSRLTLNQRLALVAFVLGAVAIGATPARQGSVSISPQDLALIVQREADHVGARALADSLVKGQAEFRIIDVRDEASFARERIPTAENVPMAALAAADLPRNERLLLYADDGVHAAQAWFLLKAQGYRGAYMLRGGLDEWRDQVVSPVLATATTAEQRRENEQRAAVAAYFGGTPRAAAAGGTATPAVAAVAPAPAGVRVQLPPAAAKAKPIVKKKEGC